MNEKPNTYDEVERGEQSQEDNTPIFSPDTGNEQGIPLISEISPRISPTMIGFALFLISTFLLIMGGKYLSNRNEIIVPTSTNTATPHDLATPTNWKKPLESPTIGTSKEAKQATEVGNIPDLQEFILDYPEIPDVNQPNDLYVFNLVGFPESMTLSYGWCAISKEILDDNFNQMRIAFIINETQVGHDNLYIYHDQSYDGSFCWSNVALIKSWPDGVHRLDIRVTFTQPVDDGWNVYPKGSHTFRYFVTIDS